ncbi:MAG: FAD-dependent oxidoreductase [Bryobacteraceae bacterium]
MPYHQILELSALPDNPDVYVLGVHARRVTFYSQQCRAINLVDALEYHSNRGPLAGKSVAVIGAGAAGVTAAARLLEYEAKVTVFEKAPGPLSIQGNSRHRYLHPTIYDWPFSAIDPAESDAKLPVMNWSAGTAAEVAASLEARFKALKPVEFLPSTKVAAVRQAAGRVSVEWKKGPRDFDLVLIAAGFGLEPEGQKQNSYWEGDPVDYAARDNPSILILGYGDGALTDLMRACVLKFDHERFLQEIIRLVPAATLQEIRTCESDPRAEDAGWLTLTLSQILPKAPQIERYLRSKLNLTRKVFLAGPGPGVCSYLDPRACAINRFVAAHLDAIRAFEHIVWPDGNPQIDARNPDDPVLAELQRQVVEKSREPAKRVLFRFGPKPPAIAAIEGIQDGAAKLKEQWSRVKVAEDLTRQRLWETPFARLPSGKLARTCLVVCKPASQDELALMAQSAIQQRPDFGLDVNPVPIDAARCLPNREALLSFTRAMCSSPLVIFELGKDMGKSDLAGMMLMGIRSAVRRGVTLAVTSRMIKAKDWAELPFNLKELQILSLPFQKAQASATLLADSIASAFKTLRSDAGGYRDLPVFDIVRRTKRRTPDAHPNQVEALGLCSFSPKHEKSWEALKLALDRVDTGGRILVLRRVTEYSSPLLVAERLYELIRFARVCVVDWTEWRPNVFFELGVRMAVHRIPALIVATEAAIQSAERGEKHAFRAMFRPLTYSKNPKAVTGLQQVARLELEHRLKADSSPTDTVYEIAQRHVNIEQEFGSAQIHQQFLRAAFAAVGSDIGRSGKPAVLYSENPKLASQALNAAIETVWGAYLILEDKLGDQSLPPPVRDELSTTFDSIAALLLGLLARCDSSDHGRIRAKLESYNQE